MIVDHQALDETIVEAEFCLSKSVERRGLWLALAAIALWCVTGAWAAFRGFDPFDEAWYVITYREAKASDPLGTIAPFVIRPLFDLFGGSIVCLRLVKLTAWLALGAYFGTSVGAWINGTTGFRRVSPLLVGAFFTTATMVVYTVYPQTPSYNDLAVGLPMLLMAMALHVCVLRPGRQHELVVLATASGAVFVVLGLSKVTTGFVSAVTIALVLSFGSEPRAAWKTYWRLVVGAFVGGAVVCVIVIQLVIVDLVAFVQAARWTEAVVRETSTPWSKVLTRERKTLGEFFLQMWRDYGILLSPIVLALVFERVGRHRIATFAGVVAGVMFVVVTLQRGNASGGARTLATQSVALALLALVSIVLLASAARGPSGLRWRVVALALVALVFPVAQGLGSTVPYVYLAAPEAPFWLFVATMSVTAQRSSRRVAMAAVVFVGMWVLGLALAWTGLVVWPTRVWTPLWSQTESAPSSELRGVLVDRESAAHFGALRTLVNENWHGDGPPVVVGFDDLPGAVVYTEAETIAGGWFFWFYVERNARVLERACADASWPERADSPLLLIRDYNLQPAYLDAMQTCGIDFPDGYEVVGTLEQPIGYFPFDPHVTLWAPIEETTP